MTGSSTSITAAGLSVGGVEYGRFNDLCFLSDNSGMEQASWRDDCDMMICSNIAINESIPNR